MPGVEEVIVTIPADRGDTVAPNPKFTVAAIPILLSLSFIRTFMSYEEIIYIRQIIF